MICDYSEGDATNKMYRKSAPHCSEGKVSKHEEISNAVLAEPIHLKDEDERNYRTARRIGYLGYLDKRKNPDRGKLSNVDMTRRISIPNIKLNIALKSEKLKSEKLNLSQQTVLSQTTRLLPRQG